MKGLKFIRTDAHKKSLGEKWRRPKGLHNKRRLHINGYAATVKSGYQGQNSTKNMIKGKKPVVVATLEVLKSLDKKTQCAIISGGLGSKKRLMLLEESKKLGIEVTNLNVEKKIKAINDSLKVRKDQKTEIKKKKEKKTLDEKVKQKKEDKEKNESKEKKAADVELTEETEGKDSEKKEFDKLLTKKQ